jgi:hypothetical protein
MVTQSSRGWPGPRSHRRLWLAVLAAICAAGILAGILADASGPDGSQPSAPDRHWEQDIAYIARELPAVRVGGLGAVPRAAWDAGAERLEAEVPRLTDGQVLVGLARLVAMLHDDETEVRFPARPFYPLDSQWFGGHLYLLAVPAADHALLGAEVLAIDGHPVAQVMARIRSVIDYRNAGLLSAKETGYLDDASLLYWLGITGSPMSAALTARTAAGPEQTVRVTAAGSGIIETPDFFLLQSGRGEAHVPLPLYLRHGARPYWMQVFPGQQAVYLRYDQCLSDSGFQRLATQALAVLRTHRLIVDLRDNFGGDSGPFRSLIEGIATNPQVNRHGRIFGLVNQFTFSAATVDAHDLSRDTKAVLVGQPPEDPVDEYGNAQDLETPDSQIAVQYTTEIIDPSGASFGIPDVTIEPTLQQVMTGDDPVLAAALSYGRLSGAR